MFGNKHKVNVHFRTRFDEFLFRVGEKQLLNIAVNNETVLFYFNDRVVELYKKDAIELVQALTENMQNVLNKLKE